MLCSDARVECYKFLYNFGEKMRNYRFNRKINFLLYRYKYLIRYIIIGVGSIFVEIIVIEIIKKLGLLTVFDPHKYLTTIIGFLAGVVFAFILNAKINFPEPSVSI